jgi:hypothetical protein
VVIKKILTHLKEKAAPEPAGLLPSVRAPPPVSMQRTGRQVGNLPARWSVAHLCTVLPQAGLA